ncbi:MAG TPA: serine hydrolase domain-containing protein, partial [Actinomycetota bacterium]
MTLDHTAEFGIDAGRVEHLVAEAEAAVQAGLTPSCQLALAREGRVALFTALGQATTGHRYVVFSVTKALIAAAMWILLDEGMLTRSTHVVELVPEFGTNGKEAVTVQHLLTHTAGFPRAPMHPLEGGTREERVRRFEQWWLDWEPGTRFEYHPSSAHWVLAHLIQAVTGDDYRSWIKQRVISPFGLRRLELGAPRAEQEDVLDVRMIGEMAGRRALSDAGIQNADYLLAEMGARQLLRYNEPDVREVGVPGAGGVSTAADVALFFQA